MPVVQLDLDSRDAVSGLNKYDRAVDSSGRKTDSAFAKMRTSVNNFGAAAVAGLAIAGAAVSAFAVKSVTMASSLIEAQGVFDQAFAGMTDTAETWAKELGESYHLTETAAKKSLSTFQLVLTGMGKTTAEAAKMSNQLVRVGADLGAAFDRSTAEVVNDIRSALSGSMETMDKYGIVMRQSVIDAKALEMGLAATKAEITQADRATATYNLILEKSATLTGTTAREAEGYAGQLKEAQKNISNLTTAIGTKLLPVFTKALKAFNEWITEGDRMNTIVNTTIEVIRFLMNAYLGLELALKAVIVVVASLVEGFVRLAKPLTVILDGLVAIGAIDSNPMRELEAATKSFTESAKDGVFNTLNKIAELNEALDNTKTKTEEVGETMKGSFDTATDAVEKAATSVEEEVKPAEEKLKVAVDEVTEAVAASGRAFEAQAVSAAKVVAVAKEMSSLAADMGGYDSSKSSSSGTFSAHGGALSDDEWQGLAQWQKDFLVQKGLEGKTSYDYFSNDTGNRFKGGSGYDQEALAALAKAFAGMGGVTNVFNQQISVSDIDTITSSQSTTEARA